MVVGCRGFGFRWMIMTVGGIIWLTVEKRREEKRSRWIGQGSILVMASILTAGGIGTLTVMLLSALPVTPVPGVCEFGVLGRVGGWVLKRQ